jgi:hypothetical protein
VRVSARRFTGPDAGREPGSPQDSAAVLEALSATTDPIDALRQYSATFRAALENDNRMCLCSYMAAEYDDLPAPVQDQVQTFSDVNVAWLSRMLAEAAVVSPEDSEPRARHLRGGRRRPADRAEPFRYLALRHVDRQLPDGRTAAGVRRRAPARLTSPGNLSKVDGSGSDKPT